MAFRRDVAFMHEGEPGLMRLNGQEFERVVKLIETVLPGLVVTHTKVKWESAAADLCRSRLKDAETLTHELREAFSMASAALLTYADALAVAKQEMIRGDVANTALRELIEPIADTQSKRVRDSEPLSQWEDLREITSWFDRQAEQDLQDKINAIRSQADSLYYEAAHAYSNVRDVEREAREVCISEMRQAFKRLPDFKADSNAAEEIIETSPGVLAEIGEAGMLNKESRLPGQGAVPAFGIDGQDGRTDLHEDLRRRVSSTSADLPAEWDPISAFHGKYVDPEHEQQYKMGWIRGTQDLIQAAAYEYGIPAELLAGIVYQEAGGKAPSADHIADWLRRNGVGGKDADDTSFGLMGIQVDTAAVALGYDPMNLDDKQREEIIKSLDDPRQSIVIAAKVLADAKDATDFAGVEPKQMTFDQQKELAARYNGGPDWNKPIAQGYADDFESARPDVNIVLYGN